MAAYEIPNLRFSGEAGGVIARRRFVTVNAEEKIEQVVNNTAQIIGASAVPCALNEVAEIYDGIVMVEAGSEIAAGTPIMSDAEGRAVAFVTGTGVVQAGVAITNAGAIGELLSVKI